METQNNQGMKVALVICILLVIVLGRYIAYDKFITPKTETENQKQVDESTEENNNTKKLIDDSKYFRTESMQRDINNKIVYIDLGFYKYDEDTIKYDVIVDNKLYPNDATDTNTILLDPDQMTMSEQYINDIVKLIKNNFGILKGDKDYLYFKTYRVFPSGMDIDLFIVNENGNILNHEKISYGGQSLFNLQGCQKDLYTGEDEEGFQPTYYIGEDTIYYLEAIAEDKANEYKITVNNDKVTKTLNNTCIVEGSGGAVTW